MPTNKGLRVRIWALLLAKPQIYIYTYVIDRLLIELATLFDLIFETVPYQIVNLPSFVTFI